MRIKKRWILLILPILLLLTAATVSAETGNNADGEFFSAAHRQQKNTGSASYPAIGSITPDSDGFTVTWSAYPGASSYRLFVKGTSGWTPIGDTAALTLRHPSLEDQTEYTYTVRAMDSSDSYISTFSPDGWSKVFRTAPVLTSVVPDGNALRVSWQGISGAGSYRVYRLEGAAWVGIGFTDENSYLDSQVVSGRSYTYSVRAYSADRKTMLSAYRVPGMTSAYVSMPVIAGVEGRYFGVTIRWSASAGAAGYRVFVRSSIGWTPIGDTAGLSFDYTIVPTGRTLTYTVRAMNADGAYVSDFDRDGMSHTYLRAPRLKSLINVDGGQRLIWDRVPGAGLYRIYILRSGAWQVLTDTASCGHTVTGLNSGAAYTYTVRCMSADGQVFLSAFQSPGLTLRYYAAPRITSVESLGEGARIRWGAVPGAAQYRVFVRGRSGWKVIGDVAGTTCLHENARQGISYTYTVRAMNASDIYISGYSVAGYTSRYQTAPLLTDVVPARDGAILTWSAYGKTGKYRVLRRIPGGQWTKVADVSGTIYTDKEAPDSVPCQYTVQTLDVSGRPVGDYIEYEAYYKNGVYARGESTINGYLVTFDKGAITKGYLTPQQIIDIAEAEVGTVATNYKHCKYNNWYYGEDISGDYLDWCVVFVEWVFEQAGARDLLFDKTNGAEYFGQGFYYHNQLVYSDYQVGDLLLLHWKEGESAYVPGVQLLNHVAIIKEVNPDGSYTTIEGNTGDDPNGAVMIKTRWPELISCACRPKYGFYIPAN